MARELTLDEALIRVNDIRSQIAFNEEEIEQLKDEMKNLNIMIVKKCPHDWLVDTTVISEHTTYYCRRCGLSKFLSFIYNNDKKN